MSDFWSSSDKIRPAIDKNMSVKFLVLTIIVLGNIVSAVSAQICDETGSYNKVWTTEARVKEAGREEREKYLKTLTLSELARISNGDLDFYPTKIMSCGMGFSEGLAKIFVNGKAGFIDPKGKAVIAPKFKDAGRFSENLAPVEVENGKWGYINKSGKIVIKPEFDWALIFREGLALIQIGEKWGFIDSTGKVVVKPQFDHANSFSENLAHAQVFSDKYYSGYIDKNGNWAIQPTFASGNDFYNGKAIIDQDVKDDKGNYKYTECYLIDKSGKKLKELEECSRTIRFPKLLDSSEIKVFFKGHKTGYKTGAGRIIWKPTS
jgi:WG containing repeat